MAHIDSFLFRRYRSTQDIITLFNNSDEFLFFQPQLSPLQYRLKISKRELVGALLGMVTNANSIESRIAWLTLWECTDPEVQKSVEHLYAICSPSRPYYHSLKTLAERWCAPSWMHDRPARISSYDDSALKNYEMHLAREGWEPEEAAEIWLNAMGCADALARIQLLKNAARLPSFQITAIADLELLANTTKVLVALCGLLAQCPESKAGEQLKTLTEHPVFAVRTEAQLALKRWESGERRVPPPPPREVEAWIADASMTGIYHIIHVTEEPKGNYKMVYCEVDCWDRGLYKCWGHPRLEAEDIALLRGYFSRSICKAPLVALEPRMARGWIQKGLELTRIRSYKTTISWGIWSRQLLECGPWVAPPDVLFGRHCIMCGHAIKREFSREMKSLVLDPIAVCSACLRKRNQCDRCGKKQAVRKMRAIAHPEVGRIEFFCESCYEKRTSSREASAEA